MVLDPKLLELIDIAKGLAPLATVILNYPDPTAAPKFQGVKTVVFSKRHRDRLEVAVWAQGWPRSSTR